MEIKLFTSQNVFRMRNDIHSRNSLYMSSNLCIIIIHNFLHEYIVVCIFMDFCFHFYAPLQQTWQHLQYFLSREIMTLCILTK
uniref:Uncharacterized protein n=1 Tax=Cyanoderma ruficeps TaxID=181631 RepID=A0A8C3QFQ8_9PASS